MSQRLISAASARLTTSAAAAALAAPAAAATSDDTPVDVVALTDAQAAVTDAEARGRTAGASAERTRFCAVLGSDAGKANVPLAVFMLENNPTASADAIVAHLASQPAAAPAAAAAATASAAPAAAAAAATPPAALTTPLDKTPIVEVAPNANNGEADKTPADHADKLWESSMAAAATTGFGAPLAGGIPRTGN